MKITIAIPTCNRIDYFKEALFSCFNQSVLPYEIVIGDDSNNDETEKFIRLLKDSEKKGIVIRYLKNEISLGQLANVNMLIKEAKGDKFMLLHDDDLLLPNAISDLSHCFVQSPDIQAAFGMQCLIKDDGSELSSSKNERLNYRFFRTKEYEGRGKLTPLEVAIVQQFPNDCYLLNTDLAKIIGYGDKKIVGNAGDFDFGLRLGLAGTQFYFLPIYTAKYRIYTHSVARDGTDSGYQSYNLILALKDYKPRIIDYREMILKIKAPLAIVQALRKGKRKEAIRIYFSKWHFRKILTLGGIKRFLLIINPFYPLKTKSTR